MVRCKFKCTEKTEIPEGFRVKMQPVVGGSPENEKFFKFTPYGNFDFGTINKNIASHIEVGKEYFIDITLAE